ncbi:MAG: helix-turn-helix domain-containing protein [Bacteriovorax sp.]|jgi:excisionase family DNA binding protein
MEESLLTIQEASKILSMKISTLRAATFKRKIPFIKIGRLVRFRPKDLEEFIKSNSKPVKND